MSFYVFPECFWVNSQTVPLIEPHPFDPYLMAVGIRRLVSLFTEEMTFEVEFHLLKSCIEGILMVFSDIFPHMLQRTDPYRASDLFLAFADNGFFQCFAFFLSSTGEKIEESLFILIFCEQDRPFLHDQGLG